MKLYGIKNCGSVKKAMEFLKAKGVEFEFLDIKKIDEDILNSWLEKREIKDLLNLSGTSARKLNLNKEKMNALAKEELKKMILETPSLIKRPVIEYRGQIYIAKEYENLIS
ncbi:Spx/MgsR family RNA polymerase-binding regulatory protein [Campylobacter felis]|uniref:Spx/MgsR family RNA polymerase-binding regulatory protein n=1 Tax=Campylobacter felis TaxID=2974565 RepID=A0ABT7I2V9_9BACT|nr:MULTISPECIES: Spx/MgsR family RNA polymerase-binding regulatory protein [Campylobacter]MDL0101731.1 Spx/MgsR family RNA polymerase-binding regulatory protein [Campylobacter felis]MDL0102891.1 Spx/MgsR family RNA polymerase-binding regulatory protein [Campylobacter felis]MDL0108029.1 Spx/MgsR family RNA polymerase-binding regulatory protein [Campylobacter felis]MDL0109933.1 Spx/MgsR family RNA polymerase-binding regulatory protein [Campylobacter felis]MDL0146568.1 Spx/MgsR family RNA polymer